MSAALPLSGVVSPSCTRSGGPGAALCTRINDEPSSCSVWRIFYTHTNRPYTQSCPSRVMGYSLQPCPVFQLFSARYRATERVQAEHICISKSLYAITHAASMETVSQAPPSGCQQPQHWSARRWSHEGGDNAQVWYVTRSCCMNQYWYFMAIVYRRSSFCVHVSPFTDVQLRLSSCNTSFWDDHHQHIIPNFSFIPYRHSRVSPIVSFPFSRRRGLYAYACCASADPANAVKSS